MALGKHHLLTLTHLRQMSTSLNGNGTEEFQTTAKRILDTLHRSIRFDAAWVLKIDPPSLNIQEIYLHHFCQKAFSRYLDTYYHRAPIPNIRQIRHEGFVSKRGSDLIETVTWMKHPFYREVLHPSGLKFFVLGACVDPMGEPVGLIVLWRSKNRHDFSTRDSFFLEKGSTDCASILARTRPGRSDAERPEVLRLITKRNFPAVIILGRDDETLFINQEARNILSIVRSGRGLLARTEEERFLTKVRELKNRVLQGTDTSPPFEIFTFRGTTFSCRAFPLQGSEQGPSLVMILIETVKEESNALPQINPYVAGFTAREGAVANLIRQGFTNKEIASEMGIGVHTVKDHIKNIMGKLKTNTRSGIVAKIMVS